MGDVNYGTYDPQAAEEAARKAENSRWYKPPSKAEGELIFLCPPWSITQKLPWFEIKAHWKIDGFNPVACPKALHGQPCPVCDANNDLRSRKDDQIAQNLSKDIYAKPMYFYNVLSPLKLAPIGDGRFRIDYAGDLSKEIKVKPYPASKTFQDQINKILGFGSDIFNPRNGRALQITKVSSGDPKIPSKIQLVPHPERGALEEKLMVLMNNLPDLTRELPVKSFDELKSMTDVALASYRAARASGSVSTVGLPPMNVPNSVPFVGTSVTPPSGTTPPAPIVVGTVEAPPKFSPVVGGNVNEVDAMEADIRRRAAAQASGK